MTAASVLLHCDAAAPGKPLAHFWSLCVGAGRANEGLRAGWLEQMRCAHAACGFRYVRFHGLFHDDMFVYREQDGQAIYNFQYVDDLFDRLLEIGVRPFVEFGFCPGVLATEKNTVFWWNAHGSPPNDYAKWEALIRRTVVHWVERYGVEEVRSWYFEVWNEPNLHPFFTGTRSQYFELYRVTARAVKSVDAALRVGGPATSNFVPDARFDGETEDRSFHAAVTGAADLDALTWRPVWLEAFLQFCQQEKLPVDFVSCHPYPTDWPLDTGGNLVKCTRRADATRQDLTRLRAMVDASPFPQAEIHLTEWNSSPSPQDFNHDFLQAATFIAKANIESVGLVDSLSYWTFTDVFEEAGGGREIFHGGFGLINYQGIVKPAFHAYRFLHALGDEQLTLTQNGGIVTRFRGSGRLAALAYHYPEEMVLSLPISEHDGRVRARQTRGMGQDRHLSVEWTGLQPHAPVVVETLAGGHGDAGQAWLDLGKPGAPTREQIALLRQAGRQTRLEFFAADAEGRFSLARPLEAWSLVLIREC